MTDRQAFLAARCGRLGGSDLATLLGHGFGVNPLSKLWHQKRQEFLTGKPVDTPGSWPMDVGTALESLILDYAERELGPLKRNWEPKGHPDYPWLICNLDAGKLKPDGKPIPVDAKKVSSWKRDEWDNGVPEKYRIQLNCYEFVYGADHGFLVPAIGEDEPIVVRVERDDALIARMLEAGDAFMLSIELGEELFDAPTQTEKTVREEAVAVDGALAEKVALWLRLREEIGPKSKQVEALAKEITDLSPKGARKLALDGVEVLRFDQRSNPRTDWDRLRAENPGLIERYALSPTVSTFPVVVRRKNP